MALALFGVTGEACADASDCDRSALVPYSLNPGALPGALTESEKGRECKKDASLWGMAPYGRALLLGEVGLDQAAW